MYIMIPTALVNKFYCTGKQPAWYFHKPIIGNSTNNNVKSKGKT